MQIIVTKDTNIRTLSWAIFEATGLNLGGWNNPSGIPQTGSLVWSESDGLTVTCPDATPLATVAQIKVLIAAHDPVAPPPADFPVDPAVVPTTDSDLANIRAAAPAWSTLTTAQKVEVVRSVLQVIIKDKVEEVVY